MENAVPGRDSALARVTSKFLKWSGEGSVESYSELKAICGKLGPAIVLSCAGAQHGALNAIRSLGIRGVPIVVFSDGDAPALKASRYVTSFNGLPGYSSNPGELVNAVRKVALEWGAPPVVLPTADPDLATVMRAKEDLATICHVVCPDPILGLKLINKARFADLALEFGLPAPRTWMVESVEELREVEAGLRYPVVIKPSDPNLWRPQEVEGLSWSTKAVRADDHAEFRRYAAALVRRGFPLVVQEYVPGPDDNHVDLHALIGRDGGVLGIFTGRKLRLFPAHAGSGCFVKSERVEEVVEIGIECLRSIGFSGLANLNFKRHAISGKYALLEINPRLSQWHILTTHCDVNLPWLAYLDAVGLASAVALSQDTTKFYLSFTEDRKSFLEYKREGLLHWSKYLSSISAPWRTIYQNWSLSDPKPFFADLFSMIRKKFF